jgi:DtxR family Mn-dependent transcriptional regulator
MLQKLAALEPPLVVYHKSHGARLTADGEHTALSIVRCHRLLELFLHEKLGYTWDEVHEEADRLEHAVGDEMAGRIAAALGHPTRDPHGQAIPAADLSLEYVATVPLHSLPPGTAVVVHQVGDDDPALLRLFAALGLRPGAPLVLLGTAPDGTLRLRVAGCDVELAAAAAKHLLVIIDES